MVFCENSEKQLKASKAMKQVFLIVGDFGNVILPFTLLIGQIGLAVAAYMTAMTGWEYLKKGLPHMKD